MRSAKKLLGATALIGVLSLVAMATLSAQQPAPTMSLSAEVEGTAMASLVAPSNDSLQTFSVRDKAVVIRRMESTNAKTCKVEVRSAKGEMIAESMVQPTLTNISIGPGHRFYPKNAGESTTLTFICIQMTPQQLANLKGNANGIPMVARSVKIVRQ